MGFEWAWESKRVKLMCRVEEDMSLNEVVYVYLERTAFTGCSSVALCVPNWYRSFFISSSLFLRTMAAFLVHSRRFLFCFLLLLLRREEETTQCFDAAVIFGLWRVIFKLLLGVIFPSETDAEPYNMITIGCTDDLKTGTPAYSVCSHVRSVLMMSFEIQLIK